MKKILGYRYCLQRGRLDRKFAVVTGANRGIGFETAGELARRGCTVIMACRDVNKAEDAKEKLIQMYGNGAHAYYQLNSSELAQDYSEINSSQLIAMSLDLANFLSVVSFTEKFKRKFPKLDLLICNAAIMMCPYHEGVDGLELQMTTNHLANVILTELLMSSLEKADEPRVIMVSAKAQRCISFDLDNFMLKEKNYSKVRAFANSKTANILYALHIARRNNKLLAYSLHPGISRTKIETNLPENYQKLFKVTRVVSKSAWEGCQTIVHCCLAPKSEMQNGAFYIDCQLASPSKIAQDPEAAEKLMENTFKLLLDVPSCRIPLRLALSENLS